MSTRVSRAVSGLVLMTAITIAAGSCRPGPNASSGIPPFDARAALGRWVSLWAGYDLQQVEDLFVWDSATTYWSSEREGLIRGPVALRDHHTNMGFVDGGRPSDQELWVDSIVSSVYGSTAVVAAVWYFGDRAVPQDRLQRGPMTAVYVWSGDRYKIAHMHFANY